MRRSHVNTFLSLNMLFILVVSGCTPAKPGPAQTKSVPLTTTVAPPTVTSLPPTPIAGGETPTATAISPEVISGIDGMLADLARQSLFTGSVLIAHHGEVLLSKGYGLADRIQNIPNLLDKLSFPYTFTHYPGNHHTEYLDSTITDNLKWLMPAQ